jgi:4-hydroxy-3-methylbut-2-enyl diphosphate reductase
VPTFHIAEPDGLISPTEIRHRPVTPPGTSYRGVAERTSSGWLPPEGPLSIGLTAGASTPNNIVGQVIDRLAAFANSG